MVENACRQLIVVRLLVIGAVVVERIRCMVALCSYRVKYGYLLMISESLKMIVKMFRGRKVVERVRTG